jgi:hypothetical protein
LAAVCIAYTTKPLLTLTWSKAGQLIGQ